jgi:hypothetical protein
MTINVLIERNGVKVPNSADLPPENWTALSWKILI